MNYTKISKDIPGVYGYEEASNDEMAILGFFFSSDVGCLGGGFFKDWVLESTEGDAVSGNTTDLEREVDDILLSYEYSEELIPTQLRMTVGQFLELLDEWQEKVVKLRPKEVVIKHEHGQFFIETSDE